MTAIEKYNPNKHLIIHEVKNILLNYPRLQLRDVSQPPGQSQSDFEIRPLFSEEAQAKSLMVEFDLPSRIGSRPTYAPVFRRTKVEVICPPRKGTETIPDPATLPEPWRTLAEKITGGIWALAERLATHPKTIWTYAHGEREMHNHNNTIFETLKKGVNIQEPEISS